MVIVVQVFKLLGTENASAWTGDVEEVHEVHNIDWAE